MTGRRSLLVHYPDAACHDLVITSVAPSYSGEAMLDQEDTNNLLWQVCICVGQIMIPNVLKRCTHIDQVARYLLHCLFGQELPPGIYSLDISTCSAAYGAAQRVCRHAWTDPLWDRLGAYERAADIISPSLMHADDTAALQAAAAHVLELLAHAVAVRCMSMDHRCEAGTASGSRSAELLEGPYPDTVGARAGGDSATCRSKGDSTQAGGDDDVGRGQAGSAGEKAGGGSTCVQTGSGSAACGFRENSRPPDRSSDLGSGRVASGIEKAGSGSTCAQTGGSSAACGSRDVNRTKGRDGNMASGWTGPDREKAGGLGGGKAGDGRACAALAPAPVLVLFSGGVDSTLLAILAHRALGAGAPIDLACVCFDGGRSPDRHAHRPHA